MPCVTFFITRNPSNSQQLRFFERLFWISANSLNKKVSPKWVVPQSSNHLEHIKIEPSFEHPTGRDSTQRGSLLHNEFRISTFSQKISTRPRTYEYFGIQNL